MGAYKVRLDLPGDYILNTELTNPYTKVIPVRDACRCNRLWHSRLPKINEGNIIRTKKHVCFGAFSPDHICFGSAIWSSPVARYIDDETTLELRRLALSPSAPKNSASWMIGKMVKYIRTAFPEITTLISYQDTEVHKGTIYKASNWGMSGISKGGNGWLSRDRNKPQTTSQKVRWEYKL